MKTQVKAKDLAAAVSTILAVHDFGDSSDVRQPCCLSATDAGLTLESAKLGAYIVKRIGGKLLRKGTVGANAKDLAGMKLSGDVIIDASTTEIKIKDKRTTYIWAVDDNAQNDVNEQKGDIFRIPSMAKVPTNLLKAGAKFATYKSEVKGDYDVQVTIDKQYFEYCGIDHLSYGRYESKDKRVKVKKPFHFILGNSLLAKVMKEVDGDELTIGSAADGSIVRISSGDLDLFHPTVEKEYLSTKDAIKDVTSGEKLCSFTVPGNTLKEALDRVAPVGKKAPDVQMDITVSKSGKVMIKQTDTANTAESLVKTDNVQTDDNVLITVRAQYLKEFVKVAPTSVPLTVESWDGKFLRITVREDPGLVDYLAMMLE